MDDQKRQDILDAIKAGGGTCRGIARDHNVNDKTVRNIAKAAGITDPFPRGQTEKATRARTIDMAANRSLKATALLEDFDRLRERAWSEYEIVVGSKDGADIVTLKLPPLRDVQAAYTSMAMCIDKHRVLVDMDRDPEGLAAVDAWLRGITGQ